MKNYLKPYTACTTVESEGYLLAGGSKDTPGAENGQIKPGTPGSGSGQAQTNSTNNAKSTQSFLHSVAGDENSFYNKYEE